MSHEFLRVVVPLCVLALASCGKEPPLPAAPPSAPHADDSGPGVTVDAEQQKRLGVELVDVVTAPGQAVAMGTAIVLDSAAFAAALDEIDAARTESASLRENANRLQDLSAEGNASAQALEAARTQAASAHARLSSSEAKARSDWGADLIDDSEMRSVRAELVHRRSALLRAEFPGSLPADAAQLKYAVEFAGSATSAPARFVNVSHAAAVSANGAAVTLIASADSALGFVPRPGTRLPVTASDERGPARVLVPEIAAIADSGQLWCYVARSDGRFDRVELAADERMGSTYPAPALKAGDRVVVRGAPLLLSLERGAGAANSAPSDDD
jgi:predicted small lipoprotein YifL